MTVYLLDSLGGPLTSATTAQDGSYHFDRLAPGTYGVKEVQPQAYLDGQDTPGSVGGTVDGNDLIDQIKLVAATSAVHYDFGELLPAKISGYVFVDGQPVSYKHGTPPPDQLELLRTHDGVLDAGDRRLGGVVLRLADANGVPILDAQGNPRTAVTDANGYYEFDGLLPGVYTVIQDHPQGYIDGVNKAGTNGGAAINALTILENPELTSELAFDATNTEAIIRIRLAAGDHGQNYNFSELLLREDSLPPGPRADAAAATPANAAAEAA